MKGAIMRYIGGRCGRSPQRRKNKTKKKDEKKEKRGMLDEKEMLLGSNEDKRRL